MSIITHLVESLQGKHPLRTKRSPEWSALEQSVLKEVTACEGCGYKHFLQVHHIVPFHLAPELELKRWNLIVLCEPPHRVRKCHIIIGHLGDFKQYNPDVREMAADMLKKIQDAHERAYGKTA